MATGKSEGRRSLGEQGHLNERQTFQPEFGRRHAGALAPGAERRDPGEVQGQRRACSVSVKTRSVRRSELSLRADAVPSPCTTNETDAPD
jgi:hypothetical protein